MLPQGADSYISAVFLLPHPDVLVAYPRNLFLSYQQLLGGFFSLITNVPYCNTFVRVKNRYITFSVKIRKGSL